jgi:hypothetical protein
MDWTVDTATAESLLMQYSEWLDEYVEREDIAHDGCTHEDLARTFIAQRNPQACPKVIA